MQTEKLARWLSLAANFGVLIGLFFLILELRQNNRLVDLESQSRTAEDVNSIIDMVLQDDSLMEIQYREPSELTELEYNRLLLLGTRLLANFQDRYENMRAGLLAEDDIRRTQSAIFHRPNLNYGLPLAWESFRNRANPEFRDWFEQNVVAQQ